MKIELGMAAPTSLDLLSLPEDAIIHIFRKLSHENLITVGFACKAMYNLASTDSLWMNLCNYWKGSIDVMEWRKGMNSGKSLFRLLRFFNKLIGLWSARELSPRGGILYLKWGHIRLIASRIWTCNNGDIILRPFFEVIGLLEGSFKIQFFSGDADFVLAAKLIWSSNEETEFELQLCQPSEASSAEHRRDREIADESSSNNSCEAPEMLQTCHLERIVRSIGPDHRVIGSPDEILDENVHLSQEHLLHRFLRSQDDQQVATQDQESTSNPECIQGGQFGHQALQKFRCYALTNITPVTKNLSSSARINNSIYAKLKVDEPKPYQELAGLWSAIYGPHGVEIVNVSYTDEEIIATKLLGDPNVPCNKVTFRATLSSENTDAPLDFLLTHITPGEENALNISRMYKGRGRIAESNYRNPKWVPGQLLVQQNGNIAFLWEDVHFVICFHRLHLELFSSCPE